MSNYTVSPWKANGLTVTKSNGEKITVHSRPGGQDNHTMKINRERLQTDAKLVAEAPKLKEILNKIIKECKRELPAATCKENVLEFKGYNCMRESIINILGDLYE